MPRQYDALVLDIDGTLLDDREQLSPRTSAAIAEARRRGVKVMLATGRSHTGAHEVAEQLQLDLPSIVFNGAGLYCSQTQRMLEHRTLPAPLVAALLRHAQQDGLLPVVASLDGQFVRAALPHETSLLVGFTQLNVVEEAMLDQRVALRMTLFSQRHLDSTSFQAEVAQAAQGHAAYYTHFPLAALAHSRDSSAQVVDIQPDCQGKAEALRILQEQHGIPAERVVAVGDAGNDLPILQRAGLGVAMGNATPDVQQCAKRIIGTNNSSALAELIEALFVHADG